MACNSQHCLGDEVEESFGNVVISVCTVVTQVPMKTCELCGGWRLAPPAARKLHVHRQKKGSKLPYEHVVGTLPEHAVEISFANLPDAQVA